MERIEDCISFLVGKAAQQVARRAKEKLSRYGVTPVQYAVLKVLWEEDCQSGGSIGDRLILDSATMTGVIDRLERKGLIQRHGDPADRRVHRVLLTSKGKRLRKSLDKSMNELNQEAELVLGLGAPSLKRSLAHLGDEKRWGLN